METHTRLCVDTICKQKLVCANVVVLMYIVCIHHGSEIYFPE